MEPGTLIREGLWRLGVPHAAATVERLTRYVLELERWNNRINLTGKREPEQVVKELLYDTFYLHRWIRGASLLLDVGSGAGIPGIPLAILETGLTVISVESRLKKAQFQRHVKRALDLSNLLVMHARVEDLEPVGADAMTAKAFGSVETILSASARHLERGGRAYLVRGRAETMPVMPGFEAVRDEPYVLPGTGKEYRLFVYKRIP